MKIDIFERYFQRTLRTSDNLKITNFSRRINAAPKVLVIAASFFALILGRNRYLDKILLASPFLQLFQRFLSGNARLIQRGESETNAQESHIFANSNQFEKVYDVIIIGSGPGGAIAALREKEKGKSVLVLEAGKEFSPGKIEHHSLTQTVNQFGNQGLSFIWGTKPVLYAEGRTLGGGSEVNSGLYHRLEGHHRERILNTLKVTEANWRRLEDKVEKAISVQKQPIEETPNHGLVKGAIENGLVTREIPRWRKYSPVEEHQSMQVTYLSQARLIGAEFMTNIQVQRIIPNSDFIHVEGISSKQVIRFTCKEVVLSAGTVETPRILCLSGLTKKSFPLNFHPMLRAVGKQSTPINDGDLFPSWQAWTDDLKFKYGYSVSTYPYLNATLPSLGEFKEFSDDELSTMAAYFASFTLSDSKAKLIKIKSRLVPVISWGEKDKEAIKYSTKQLKKILMAGDAIEVWPKMGTSPITTVHLFGSIPLGISSLVDNCGRLKTDNRIRVSDGSLFPHAPFGNPQGPIMVLCELMSERIELM